MTSMQQIELISVEARKRGMKYGEYVEKYGHTVCGTPFMSGRKDAKFCPDCTRRRRIDGQKRYMQRMKEQK